MATKSDKAVKISQKHLLGIQDLSISDVNYILNEAKQFIYLNKSKNKKLDTLRGNPDTALMLIPIESINIGKDTESKEAKYRVYGEFAEIIESEVTESQMDIPQIEYLYDLSLVVTLPGKMITPIEISNGDNTVIFEPNGREMQTFEAVSVDEGGLSFRYDLITVATLLFIAMLAFLFIRKKTSQ